MEFIGSKRVHASAHKSFEFAAQDDLPELFGTLQTRVDLENHILEWTDTEGLSGALEVAANGPSQADLTLKVWFEISDDARAAQIPTLIELALERVRDGVEMGESG